MHADEEQVDSRLCTLQHVDWSVQLQARLTDTPVIVEGKLCQVAGGRRVDGRYVGFTLMWERSTCGFRVREA